MWGPFGDPFGAPPSIVGVPAPDFPWRSVGREGPRPEGSGIVFFSRLGVF